MAAAGAVVGGGTIFAGNNAVYAAENEQGVVGSQSEEQIIESQSVSESTTESLSQAKSETSNFESEASAATTAVEGNTVQTNLENGFVKRAPRFFNNEQAQSSDEQNIMLADETGNEKAVNENSAEQEAASLSVSGSVSGSISEVGSQISSESISGSEAESEMVSESSSISTSTEDFKSESERLSTSSSLSTSTETSTYTSESESLSKEFTSASESFESQKNQTLEDLITNINKTKRELEEIRQNAIKDNHHYLDGNYQNDAYRKKADELAMYLAQYNFYQKYGVGKVTEISTQYNNNGVYSDNNGNHTFSPYFDRNNFFVKYQTEDNKIYTGYFDWVAVQEKIGPDGKPLTDNNGNILYEYTPYEKTDPSKVVQIVVIEKAPIYSDEKHEKKFYYYEDSNGKIHAYFSEKDSWDPFNRYQPNFVEIQSFSKDDIISENGSEIEFNYNGKHYKFTVKTQKNGDHVFPYFGQVEDDLNIDANSSTTIKGKSYFSIKDFEKQQTEYDKQRSEFTSVSEKQSGHKSDSIKNSESKSESLSLSTSNSNSKSNVDTSDSLSKSESLSLENSDIESRSNSHSSLESTEISKSLSNSQSTSTSVSDSQSTSTSVSSSQSTSTSVSESQSTSISVSSSQSTSTSVSESQSTSASASLSGSASVSALESESLSNSVFESLSNSLSSSESTSLSSSESVSASDSFATSVTTTTTGGDTTYRRVVVDTRAPLQVAPRETEEVVEDETPKANPEEQTETIEKEKMPKSTLDVTHRVWWSWIPIVGALVSMNETRKRRKEENDADKEKEEESKDKKLK